MIEIISKLSGMFKASAREDKRPEIENTVPGDNFPYAVMLSTLLERRTSK